MTYSWSARASAYDDYIEAKARKEREETESELRRSELEEKRRIRHERLILLEKQQWEDASKLRTLAEMGIEYLKANPGKLTGSDVIKLLILAQELQEKSLKLADMSEEQAIATLVNSDLLPEEVINIFADAWDTATQTTREKIKELYSEN